MRGEFASGRCRREPSRCHAEGVRVGVDATGWLPAQAEAQKRAAKKQAERHAAAELVKQQKAAERKAAERKSARVGARKAPPRGARE